MINDNGLSNLSVDIGFLEEQFSRLGKANLTTVFDEIHKVGERSDSASDPLQPFH